MRFMSEGEEGRLWFVERRGECRFEWESEGEMREVRGDEKRVKDTNRQWCQHKVSTGTHCFDHNFLLQCQNSKVFFIKIYLFLCFTVQHKRFVLIWPSLRWNIKNNFWCHLNHDLLDPFKLNCKYVSKVIMQRGHKGTKARGLNTCVKWCKVMIVEY